MRNGRILRRGGAVVFVLPVVALGLDIVVDTDVVTHEMDRYPVGDLHFYAEPKLAEGTVLGGNEPALPLIGGELCRGLADGVEGAGLAPEPVGVGRMLEYFDFEIHHDRLIFRNQRSHVQCGPALRMSGPHGEPGKHDSPQAPRGFRIRL